MSSENLPLSMLCSIKQGRYLSPSEMSATQSLAAPIPVIGGNGVLGYTDRISNNRDVVLVTCRGSRCGLLQWVRAPVWVSNNAIACDTGTDLGNQLLRYLLSCAGFEDVTTGSAQPQITVGHLSAKRFDVPPKASWSGIVSLLSVIDDRIALLRETNATLEAIAQALFKSWFIDFDPVRAKQQGQTPAGMDEATAALFPDGFEESASGPVPAGWRASLLADAFAINPVRTLKKGAIARYLDMASVATSGHCVDQPVLREFGSGTKFRNGDTLLARITPCLENGKSAFVDFLDGDQVGWGSTEFVVLRPKAPLPEYFGYLLARHPPFREYAIRSMSGTSGRQRVQNDILGRYLIAMPTAEIACAFSEIVTPMQKAIAANQGQVQTLATLRDTLLPRLISGQLRLPDIAAESPVEATA